jgi:hypothetical protein
MEWAVGLDEFSAKSGAGAAPRIEQTPRRIAVKFLFKLSLLALVALLASPLAAARAQSVKPVAVVSIASINENLADLEYLTRIAGMEDAGKSANFFARALTAGIDKSRPFGLYVVSKDGDFPAIAFIPVNDLKVLLEVQKDYLGTPKDVGNGIQEVGTDRTAFIKEQGGWVFAAEDKAVLTGLPQDPAALLANLPTNYNASVRLLVQNIPAELRKTAIDQIKIGMDRGLSGGRGNVDRKGAEQAMKAWLGNLEQLINETEEVTIGLGIDAEKKHTVLDFNLTAKDGSTLARKLALQMDAKTRFGGFLMSDASVNFNAVGRSSPEDLQQVSVNMKAQRELWSKQIDDSPHIPADKREPAKRLLAQFMDVLEKTAASGKGDLGGTVMLLPKSISFVVGGYVADGPGLDKALQGAYELAKDQPDFPKVQLNAGTLGDLKLHRLSAKIPEHEPEARDLLGETLEIIVAIGPQSVFVSGGKDAEGLLKNVLEASAAEADKSVPPVQINISLLPILKFYRSVDDNPIVTGLISKLEQTGSDRITIITRPGARDTTTRIEIQEGLIKAIGEGANAVRAGVNAN